MTKPEKRETKALQQGKDKDRPTDEQTIQFEDRVSRSRSKHEGESSGVSLRQAQPNSR
jgi:hypothetical protein